jgi:hypothetical protein
VYDVANNAAKLQVFDTITGQLESRIILHSTDNTRILQFASPTNYFFGTGTPAAGTNAAGVLALFAGTAPTTSPADTVQLWVSDCAGAGTACLNIRDEPGNTFSIGNGIIRAPAGSNSVASVAVGTSATGLSNANGDLTFVLNGVTKSRVATDGFFELSGLSLAFSSVFNSMDLYLVRDAANTLAQRNGTNAQTYRLSAGSGHAYDRKCDTELLSVGSGVSTKASTITIPADARVQAVPVRVITQPGGTTTTTVTATTSGTAFQKGASISTVAGTTDPGTKNTEANYNGVAAQTVTLTFDAPTTDALGSIRLDICHVSSTPPTA